MVIHSVPNNKVIPVTHRVRRHTTFTQLTKVNATVEIKRDCDLRPDSKDSQNESDNGLGLNHSTRFNGVKPSLKQSFPLKSSFASCFLGWQQVSSLLYCVTWVRQWLSGTVKILSSLHGPVFFFSLSFVSLFSSQQGQANRAAVHVSHLQCQSFQHSKPSENQSGRKRDAVPSRLQVLAMMNIHLAIKTSSSSFFLVLN